VPYDDEITPAQAIRKTWGWVPFGLNAVAASGIIALAVAGTIIAGDTYYHCSDAAGKSINSSPVSGPGTSTPAPTQSSQALAS